jgi:hypothetical protein
MEHRALLSTLTVTNTHDSGSGSLRAAISGAASGDTINFAHALDGKTIVLSSGELAIGTSVDIEGPGANRLSISGGGASRVFDVTTSGLNVTISGLTIKDGSAPQGGGIIDQGGTLTLSNDVVADNQAHGVNPGDPGIGGGVFVTLDALGNFGTMTVQNSELRSNVAQGAAGLDNSSDPSTSHGGQGLGGGHRGRPKYNAHRLVDFV